MRRPSEYLSFVRPLILVFGVAARAVAQSVAAPPNQPPPAEIQRAGAAFAQSNWKEANALYSELAARYPFRLAESLAEQKKLDAAMSELRQAIGAGFFAPPSTLEANVHFASMKTHQQWQLVIDTLEAIVKPCRHDARYREFDFWIGDWDVRPVGTATGPASRNAITLEENGCVGWTMSVDSTTTAVR